MRIKKVSETTPINGKAIDSYSSSTTDAYSCNYINQNVISKNKLDMYSLVDGYISANGAYNNGHTQEEMRSDFIKVKPNTTHTFTIFESSWSGFGTNNWMAIAEYTSDNTSSFVIRNTMVTVSQNYITVTTSATTEYIIVCARGLASATKVQLEESESTTTYQKYFTNGVVNTLVNNEEDMAPSVNAVNKLTTYSTDEQRVGTWVDGKPLYRRAFIQNISSQTVARIATLSDIDNIFITDKSTTIIKESSHHFFVPVSTYETSNNFSKFYVDKTVSDNSAKLNWAGNSTSGTLIAVVEYTKTTD